MKSQRSIKVQDRHALASLTESQEHELRLSVCLLARYAALEAYVFRGNSPWTLKHRSVCPGP
jgi:hypothetical protein